MVVDGGGLVVVVISPISGGSVKNQEGDAKQSEQSTHHKISVTI